MRNIPPSPVPPKPPEQSPPGKPGASRPSTSAPRPPGGGKVGVERAMALRDVMNHVVDVETENARPSTSGDSRRRDAVLWTVCIVMLALAAYSYAARPEFIWGPQHHEGTPQQATANTRMAVFLLSRRVEAYKAANGRYPASLSAVAGSRDTLFTYTLVSENVYRITARGPTGDVTYQSDTPADAFLGNSMRVLSTGAKH